MNKKYVFLTLIILACLLIVSLFFVFKNTSTSISKQSTIKENIALERSLEARNGNPSLDKPKFVENKETVESFALKLAKTYFDSNPQFDSDGLSVQRVLDVYSGEKCGDYQIVIFEKNGIYGGSASIVTSSTGGYEYLSVGPGNYSDKEYSPEKPEEIKYLSLEEATQRVLSLKSDLVFDKYVNPCILQPNGDSKRFLMPDYAYFRFLDSENDAYLFIINGQHNGLIHEKTAIINQIDAALAPEDPNWLKVDYTDDQISKYFASPIPEERIKVTRTQDGEKIYQLVFDQNKDVQYAALSALENKKISTGVYYLEQYYEAIIHNTELSYESINFLLRVDYSGYEQLTQQQVWNEIKKSSSFEKLSISEKQELGKMLR